MSSKYQKKVSEIYTLTNQIRLQMQQIKCGPPPKYYRKDISAKRHFHDKNNKTDIVNPSQDQFQTRNPFKRYFDKTTLRHQNFDKPFERKHFDRYYKDSVDTSQPKQTRRSSYLNIKTQVSPSKLQTNILMGVGQKSTEKIGRPRSCIRTYPQRYQ